MTITNFICAFFLSLGLFSGGVYAGEPAQDADKPVTLIIDFLASEEGHEAFDGIMSGVSDAMAGEAGFVSAVVHRDVDDPRHYVLIEVWETRALHEAHYQRINESGDWAYIKSLLSEEPRMAYFRTPDK